MQVTGVLGVAHLAGSTYIAAFCWTLLIPLFVWTPQNSPVVSSTSCGRIVIFWPRHWMLVLRPDCCRLVLSSKT